MAALHLLLSDSAEAALPLARELDATNRERQNEERRVLKEALADAEALASDTKNRVLVVSRRGWHEGVVGIVASRLVREFHMPAFVIALGPDGEGKGSGRSVEGFNLAHAVQSTASLLLRGGGHAMAAGVSIREDNVEAWRIALQKHAREEQGQAAGRLARVLHADAQVDLGEIREELVADLARLEPCGMGNPRPVLMARGVAVAAEPKRVGKEGAHLKLWLRQNGTAVDAIAFGKGSLPVAKGDRLDILFEAGINEYQGARRPQMNLREIAKEAQG
jgi:single-stranded-DNA-specific exonuclease